MLTDGYDDLVRLQKTHKSSNCQEVRSTSFEDKDIHHKVSTGCFTRLEEIIQLRGDK